MPIKPIFLNTIQYNIFQSHQEHQNFPPWNIKSNNQCFQLWSMLVLRWWWEIKFLSWELKSSRSMTRLLSDTDYNYTLLGNRKIITSEKTKIHIGKIQKISWQRIQIKSFGKYRIQTHLFILQKMQIYQYLFDFINIDSFQFRSLLPPSSIIFEKLQPLKRRSLQTKPYSST